MLKHAFIAACLAAACTFPHAAAAIDKPAKTVTFTFKDKSEADSWLPLLGKWKVAKGLYTTKVTADGGAVSAFPKPFTTLTAKVVIKTIPEFAGSIMVRVTGDPEAGAVSGYLFSVMPSQAKVLGSRLDDYDVFTGTGTIVPLCDIPWMADGPQTMEFSSKGTRFKLSVNGTPLCDVQDATYPKGRFMLVGFGQTGQTLAFDEVVLNDGKKK